MTRPGKRENSRARLLRRVDRWTAYAKFWLCDGIRRGIITIAEASDAHGLTTEELSQWYTLYSRDDGINPLRNLNKKRRAA